MIIDKEVLVRVTKDNSAEVQQKFFDLGVTWVHNGSICIVPEDNPDEYWVGAAYDSIKMKYVMCWIPTSGGIRYIQEGEFSEIKTEVFLNTNDYDYAMRVV